MGKEQRDKAQAAQDGAVEDTQAAEAQPETADTGENPETQQEAIKAAAEALQRGGMRSVLEARLESLQKKPVITLQDAAEIKRVRRELEQIEE